MGEGFAGDDGEEEVVEGVAVFGGGFEDGLNFGFVGDGHLAAGGADEELGEEVLGNEIDRSPAQEFAQTGDVVEFLAAGHLALGIDFEAAFVFFAPLADGVEVFQGKAEGVDVFVAAFAGGVGAVGGGV